MNQCRRMPSKDDRPESLASRIGSFISADIDCQEMIASSSLLVGKDKIQHDPDGTSER